MPMDIINKSYRRKGAADSDVFHAEAIDAGFVVFSNGARCKLETLQSDFEETASVQQINEEVIPNADTFFTTPSVDETLLNQLDLIKTNPNAEIPGSRRDSVSLDSDDDSRYEKVAPGGQKASPGLGNRLGTDDGYSALENKLDEPNHPKAIRLPEWDVFDNVKLSEEIEIVVPFKIKLPRAEKIDILNDMFKTSFTAYLAKKYINDNIVNNSIKLQTLIKDGIENWMEEEMNGGSSRKRKPVKKAKGKAAKEEPAAEVVVKVDSPANENANSFFGPQATGPKWDGDLKKLFVISTDEQYDAVKRRFVSLKESAPNNPDIDRLEDMLQIYEETYKQ